MTTQVQALAQAQSSNSSNSSTSGSVVPPQVPPFLRQTLLRPNKNSSDDPNDDAARDPDSGDAPTTTTSSSDAQDGLIMPTPPPAPSTIPTTSLLVPPLNFQNVADGISRSGHPNERNYSFLRRLKLKSIMYIANEDYRDSIRTFAESQGIQILHHRISVNKEPFGEMEDDFVADALSQILDARNHPILVHCNKGKYRVGCLIGLLRRLQGWSHTSIFEEFARFAGTKAVDEEFIEVFDLSKVKIDPEHKPHWL